MCLWHNFGGSGFIIINKLQLSCVKVIFIFLFHLLQVFHMLGSLNKDLIPETEKPQFYTKYSVS